MGYIASLRSLFVNLVERIREWNQRTKSSKRDDDPDDFLDIFLFGPHG